MQYNAYFWLATGLIIISIIFNLKINYIKRKYWNTISEDQQVNIAKSEVARSMQSPFKRLYRIKRIVFNIAVVILVLSWIYVIPVKGASPFPSELKLLVLWGGTLGFTLGIGTEVLINIQIAKLKTKDKSVFTYGEKQFLLLKLHTLGRISFNAGVICYAAFLQTSFA